MAATINDYANRQIQSGANNFVNDCSELWSTQFKKNGQCTMVRYGPFNYLGLRTRQRRAQYCQTVLEHFRGIVAAVWTRPAQLDSGRLMVLAVTQLVKSPLAGFRKRCMSPVSPTYQPLAPKPACQLSTDRFGRRKERATPWVCFSYRMTEDLRFKFSLLLKTDHCVSPA